MHLAAWVPDEQAWVQSPTNASSGKRLPSRSWILRNNFLAAGPSLYWLLAAESLAVLCLDASPFLFAGRRYIYREQNSAALSTPKWTLPARVKAVSPIHAARRAPGLLPLDRCNLASELRVPVPIGDQLRLWREQRCGSRSRAEHRSHDERQDSYRLPWRSEFQLRTTTPWFAVV